MKPINLREWEVRAIQSGATLLVRPIKPQPVLLENGAWAKKTGRDTRHLVREIINTETGESTPETVSFQDTFAHLWNSPFGWRVEVLVHKKSGLRLLKKPERVMRVQELSEADAVKSGFSRVLGESVKIHGRHAGVATKSARFMFRDQFETDHGTDAWDRNDWVAVCEFAKQETA